MLSDEEKKEFSKKIEKLKNDQAGLRNTIQDKIPKPESAGQFKAVSVVYQFVTLIFGVSIAGYFIAKYTHTLPWTMILFIVTGFIYGYYRLYKSLT